MTKSKQIGTWIAQKRYDGYEIRFRDESGTVFLVGRFIESRKPQYCRYEFFPNQTSLYPDDFSYLFWISQAIENNNEMDAEFVEWI